MLNKIKFGFILFLNNMTVSKLAWDEIKKAIDEEKAANMVTISCGH